MGYTKRQLVHGAGEEIGMANYEFDIPPETIDAWCIRMDSMMAEWNGRGIRLGYPIAANPDEVDLDAQTAVPNWAVEAIILNLAIRIAPMMGKTVSPETKVNAFRAYSTVSARASSPPPQMQLPGTMPLGAGNRYWGWGQTYVTPPQNQDLPLPEDDLTFSN